ncbi:EAL domain-containing protein [Dactylosporangium sp. NPDC051541]|uniref:EAL domain-containing protein n=1 Tax=Dactylosporangium sp. NPDC051541 TaxID=3363977 RepID=UPI0037AA5701
MHAALGTTGDTVAVIIAARAIRPLFQPIVDLDTRSVIGLEALARGPAGSALEFPDRLFDAAHAAGRLGELDMLCAERALECAVTAEHPPPVLFVNAEPGVLDQPLSPRLLELVAAGLPFREVLEFTERALAAVPGSLLRIAAGVQRFGNALALDDVGADPISLALVPVLEPEVIKLDMHLLRNPASPHTRTVSAVVRAEAARTGAAIVAEGIETEADLGTARALGARWGQGWLFGRPAPLGAVRHRYDPDAATALRPPRPDFHLPAADPFPLAAQRGPATPADLDAVQAAVAVLRDTVAADDTAILIASGPDPAPAGVTGSLDELLGQARSVILLDRPVPDEFTAVVIGAGYGRAVAIRLGADARLITLDRLPDVAAIARALLARHGR